MRIAVRLVSWRCDRLTMRCDGGCLQRQEATGRSATAPTTHEQTRTTREQMRATRDTRTRCVYGDTWTPHALGRRVDERVRPRTQYHTASTVSGGARTGVVASVVTGPTSPHPSLPCILTCCVVVLVFVRRRLSTFAWCRACGVSRKDTKRRCPQHAPCERMTKPTPSTVRPIDREEERLWMGM
jgi:hypothetical protein